MLDVSGLFPRRIGFVLNQVGTLDGLTYLLNSGLFCQSEPRLRVCFDPRVTALKATPRLEPRVRRGLFHFHFVSISSLSKADVLR